MVVAILPNLLSRLLFGLFSAPINASVISKSLPMARVFVLNGVCVTLIFSFWFECSVRLDVFSYRLESSV